jgi:hypothetical protein
MDLDVKTQTHHSSRDKSPPPTSLSTKSWAPPPAAAFANLAWGYPKHKAPPPLHPHMCDPKHTNILQK